MARSLSLLGVALRLRALLASVKNVTAPAPKSLVEQSDKIVVAIVLPKLILDVWSLLKKGNEDPSYLLSIARKEATHRATLRDAIGDSTHSLLRAVPLLLAADGEVAAGIGAAPPAVVQFAEAAETQLRREHAVCIAYSAAAAAATAAKEAARSLVDDDDSSDVPRVEESDDGGTSKKKTKKKKKKKKTDDTEDDEVLLDRNQLTRSSYQVAAFDPTAPDVMLALALTVFIALYEMRRICAATQRAQEAPIAPSTAELGAMSEAEVEAMRRALRNAEKYADGELLADVVSTCEALELQLVALVGFALFGRSVTPRSEAERTLLRRALDALRPTMRSAASMQRRMRTGKLWKVARMYRMLFSRVRWPFLIGSSALTMLSGVVNASVPFYQGNVLTQTLAAATTLARSGSSSSSSSGGGEAQQIGTVVIPVVVAIKALVIATLSQIVIENVQQQVDAAGQVEIRHVLGNALFNAMLSQDQSYMDSATNDQDRAWGGGNLKETVWKALSYRRPKRSLGARLVKVPNNLLSKVTTICAQFIYLYSTSPRYLVFVVMLKGVENLALRILKRLAQWSREIFIPPALRDGHLEMYQLYEGAVENFGEVRVNSKELFVSKKFASLMMQLEAQSAKSSAVKSLLQPARALLPSLVQITALAYGAKLCVDGALSPGSLQQFSQTTAYVLNQMKVLYRQIEKLGQARGTFGDAARVMDLLERKPTMGLTRGVILPRNGGAPLVIGSGGGRNGSPKKIAGNGGRSEKDGGGGGDAAVLSAAELTLLANPGVMPGAITFDNVVFAYPSKPSTKILRNLSFKIIAGDFVGVCGPRGCGKSSLINLVNRIYDADAGRIEVGGRNIRDWAPSYLRSQISISRQKPSLFYGSIRENVAFGAEERLDAMPSENARRDAVYDAMRAVAMHDIIMEPPPNGKFPQRYRSMLYPGYGDCSTLNAMSGGEKHSIGIARAILRETSIMILDEPTAALDAGNEKHLMDELLLRKAAFEQRTGRPQTLIIIAHRLSTLKKCSQILFIEEGAVVQSGTFASCYQEGGKFAEFVDLQSINDPTGAGGGLSIAAGNDGNDSHARDEASSGGGGAAAAAEAAAGPAAIPALASVAIKAHDGDEAGATGGSAVGGDSATPPRAASASKQATTSPLLAGVRPSLAATPPPRLRRLMTAGARLTGSGSRSRGGGASSDSDFNHLAEMSPRAQRIGIEKLNASAETLLGTLTYLNVDAMPADGLSPELIGSLVPLLQSLEARQKAKKETWRSRSFNRAQAAQPGWQHWKSRSGSLGDDGDGREGRDDDLFFAAPVPLRRSVSMPVSSYSPPDDDDDGASQRSGEI